MLIDRIYLRNYRVFEDELDLVLPPGLVGVYGPNGAGKSTLLESVLWALWGKARTAKEEVPSAGAHGECIAEVTFEHEGHIYLVRRTISGANATVRAEAHCDGLAMSEGVRDTGRYVHSVLGMDDGAFRASVFAEQKQLDAFSSQSPAERRKLVLALLGVTPLDAARDKARADARQTTEQHKRLRGMLADLEEAKVSAADAEARASAAGTAAAEEENAASVARESALAAKERFDKLDLVRQEQVKLVLEGKAARAELETAGKQAEELASELADLAANEANLSALEPLAADLPVVEQRVQLVSALLGGANELASLPEVAPPPLPDEMALAGAEKVAMEARAELGSAGARREAAAAELKVASDALTRSALLSGEEDCPLCGQALGDAFAMVQSHREAELEAAQLRLEGSDEALAAARAAAEGASAQMARLSAEVATARQALAAWEQARARRETAGLRLTTSLEALAEHDALLAKSLGPAPGPEAVSMALEAARKELTVCKQAAEEASRLRGRLERRPQAELALNQARDRVAGASSLLEALRSKVRTLGFEPEALSEAREALSEAETAAKEADLAARSAHLSATRARAQAEAEAKRFAEAEAQHALLADLESASVHLGRTAELLNGFRNSVVASVGPRLAVQAAELFGELTDNEYDRLEVDTETYGLQICDSGVSYDLERFSGSEVDLANLALRVAISEHVRFQSGGTVGLLVLDEVFGPLDEERKSRMLLALERLKGRFRQILVVTHSMEIKEQLPNAIEVVKLAGRRATARVLGGG
ncbi:MAG TPA: SMC family ATPase [Acidimicrobiales bacterium]|nr:SMC family ATPase [Acidimicrobiales bacterium]